MANKEVKTLTVDNVTYDIKDAQARADIANKQDKLPSGTTGYFLKKTATGVEWAEGAAPGGATWGNIGGTLSNQTDLQEALEAKQDVLTPGDGITIENNTISGTLITIGEL